jgi:hypothetical protein
VTSLASILARTGLSFAGRVLELLRQLFHELTGTLFLALGLMAVPTAIREWRGDSGWKAVAVTCFVALMVYYGVTSFRKAKRKR